MKTLYVVAAIVFSFQIGMTYGTHKEVRTHKAYIASLNLGK